MNEDKDVDFIAEFRLSVIYFLAIANVLLLGHLVMLYCILYSVNEKLDLMLKLLKNLN